MQYRNATDLKWIPWFRYALLLRADGKKIISLGRFRQAISAYRESLRLKDLKGYEPKVIDTRRCTFRTFDEAYEAEGYEE